MPKREMTSATMFVTAMTTDVEAQARAMLGHFRAEVHDPAGAARELQRWLELDPEGRAVAPLPVDPVRKLLARSLLIVS